MKLTQLWTDMNTWNKFGNCAVSASVVVPAIVLQWQLGASDLLSRRGRGG